MNRNFNQSIGDLLSELSEKQQKVIRGRFGLDGKKLTLQKIGDGLGITRERVRQIEEQSLAKARPRVIKELDWLLDRATGILKDSGGVEKDDHFIENVKKTLDFGGINNVGSKLRFVFLVAGAPMFYGEDDDVKSFWYIGDPDKKKLFSFLSSAVDFFKKNDKEQILEDKIYLKKFGNFTDSNFIPISKRFGTNIFDQIGLVSWPEITPRVVRDRAFLVLKQKRTPLHFTDIAKLVTDLGIDRKKAHPQTVHNELIKDERFVLVGRGLYALKEHGFEGGTVKKVIENLLKTKGPLSSKEVVRLVNERKILKENTILLNLQNRKRFKRLADGKYHIRES